MMINFHTINWEKTVTSNESISNVFNGDYERCASKHFYLENGYLEFNLEKVNMEGRHSIPVMIVWNLGY